MCEIGVIGLNSKSCPLPIREILTRAMESCFGGNGCDRSMFPYVLLSTCHRVEMYFSGLDIASIHMYILSTLREVVLETFEPYLYSFFEADVFLHLGKVTCGLDSAVLGESEIQRQVKISYENAKSQQELSSHLHYLFQKSLMLGKEIRSKYGHWKKEFSLEDVVVEKMFSSFENPKEENLLFIGNSETNRKLIRALAKKGFRGLTIISRNAQDCVTEQEKVKILSREYLRTWDQYPIVISATVDLDQLLETSKDIKRLVIDLSLPRTVHPKVKEFTQTQLLNIEDLGALFYAKKELYKLEILQSEKLIKEKIKKRYEAYQAKLSKKVFFKGYEEVSIQSVL